MPGRFLHHRRLQPVQRGAAARLPALGGHDYDVCVQYGGPIFGQAGQYGLFPIYGDIPHLTSISIPDGSVVATDWEVYGQAQHSWRAVIAPDLHEYLRTLIAVRDAYGYEEDYPSDWWAP